MIIIADENIPNVAEHFAPFGGVTTIAGRDIDAAVVKAADVLLVRSITQVNEQLLAGSSVKFVGSATTGIDHIDADYLAANNIYFTHAHGANARSVVEYVLAALAFLFVNKNIDFFNCTVGIVGLGKVGGSLYDCLTALGIKCLGCDPLIPQDSFPHMVALDELLQADIVCLHTPLTHAGDHATYHLLNSTVLAKLKLGAVLINAGRGEVVDNSALLQCMDEKQLTAVLDVWEGEPVINQQLLQKTSLATPHIAGYSYDGKLAATQMLAEVLSDFMSADSGFAEIDDKQRHVDQHVVALEPSLNNELPEDAKQQLCKTILKAYPITQDDEDCRALLGVTAEQAGKHFDSLRKNYWQRREFWNYEVSVPRTAAQLIKWLRAAGFAVKENNSCSP